MENPSELILRYYIWRIKKGFGLRPLLLLRRTYFAILYCGIIKKKLLKSCYFLNWLNELFVKGTQIRTQS